MFSKKPSTSRELALQKSFDCFAIYTCSHRNPTMSSLVQSDPDQPNSMLLHNSPPPPHPHFFFVVPVLASCRIHIPAPLSMHTPQRILRKPKHSFFFECYYSFGCGFHECLFTSERVRMLLSVCQDVLASQFVNPIPAHVLHRPRHAVGHKKMSAHSSFRGTCTQ